MRKTLAVIAVALMLVPAAFAETPAHGLKLFLAAGDRNQLHTFCGRLWSHLLQTAYHGEAACESYWVSMGGGPAAKQVRILHVTTTGTNAVIDVHINTIRARFLMVLERGLWRVAGNKCLSCQAVLSSGAR